MACTGGPYGCGTSGSCPGCCCNCNCKCCPPCPCYSSFTFKYRCGSDITDFPVEGCLCPSYTFIQDKDFPEFPDFNTENSAFNFELPDQNFVQSLQLCSIPCEEFLITVYFEGCCMKLVGLVTNQYNVCFCAVGNGIICATSAIACDTNFKVYLETDFYEPIDIAGNCQEIVDGQTYCIRIVSPNPDACCKCCEIGSTPSGIPDGPYEKTLASDCLYVPGIGFSMTKRNKITGAKKTFINKQELIKRINKRR